MSKTQKPLSLSEANEIILSITSNNKMDFLLLQKESAKENLNLSCKNGIIQAFSLGKTVFKNSAKDFCQKYSIEYQPWMAMDSAIDQIIFRIRSDIKEIGIDPTVAKINIPLFGAKAIAVARMIEDGSLPPWVGLTTEDRARAKNLSAKLDISYDRRKVLSMLKEQGISDASGCIAYASMKVSR